MERVTKKHVGKRVLLLHAGGQLHEQRIRSVSRHYYAIIDPSMPDVPAHQDRKLNRVVRVIG